jgi:hypothetical protein
MARSPYDLERNHLEGAVECYLQAVAEGASDDELDGLCRTLMLLQDDWRPFIARLPARERKPRPI